MNNIFACSCYFDDLKRIGNKFDFTILRKKTIMITGGLGLIGSAIIDLIHSLDLETKILVADINEPLFKEKYDSFGDIEFVYYNAIEDIKFDLDCDYIIHCAGLASPNLYTTYPVETMLSNFIGLLNLLKYSHERHIKRLLFISSSEVYGNKSFCGPFTEETIGISNIDNSRCSYSESKRACEVLCQSYTKEYGVETIIVRPGHVFGPTASPKDKRIASDFLFKASRGENLEMKSPGLQKRSYCYSLDCAAAVLIALLNGEAGQAYNIGHDEVTSVAEMARLIADCGGVKLLYSEPTAAETEAFNPMLDSSLSTKKIKEIGYKDSFTVKESVMHCLETIKFLYN